MKFVSFLVSLSMIVSPLYGWGQARKAMSPYQNIADDFGNAKNIHDLLMNSQGKISEDSREILMNYAKAHNLVALPTVRALDDGVKVIMKDISATFRFPIDKPGFVYVNEELYRLPENSAQMQQLIKRIEMQFDKEYPEKTASLDFLLPRAHALFQIMFFILIAGVYTIEAVSTVATVATWVLGALAVYGIHKKMIDTNKAHYEKLAGMVTEMGSLKNKCETLIQKSAAVKDSRTPQADDELEAGVPGLVTSVSISPEADKISRSSEELLFQLKMYLRDHQLSCKKGFSDSWHALDHYSLINKPMSQSEKKANENIRNVLCQSLGEVGQCFKKLREKKLARQYYPIYAPTSEDRRPIDVLDHLNKALDSGYYPRTRGSRGSR